MAASESENKNKSNGKTVIAGATALATLETGSGYLEDGYLVIEGETIREIGTGEPPSDSYDTVIDARGKLVTPGFINTHHHLYQTLTRAYPAAMDVGLFDWLETLYPLWANLDEEAVYLSTMMGMAELLLSGCTTTTDHHYVFPRDLDVIDAQIEAATEIGMRFQPCRGSMCLSQKDGGLPPDSVVQDGDVILKDSERVIVRYHDPAPNARVRISLAPCSPFSVTPTLMRDTAALARRHGVRLHTHLAETLDEERFCEAQFNLRPLEYLESVDWLEDDVWIAHGIHFQGDEIARLGQVGIGVAHCPSSNMRLGSGIAPVLKLRAAGVPVGLAVDGSASNDSSNYLLELRMALYLHRTVDGPAALRVTDVLEMATRESARCLGWEEIGALREGWVADIALFDLEHLHYSGAHNPLGALVMCAPTTVDTLLVGGKAIVKGGELQTVDVDKLTARHRDKAREIVTG
ncbi:MAG: 8-oxoguanine deaminase [Candidatus Bipolaricaulia bacterium]